MSCVFPIPESGEICGARRPPDTHRPIMHIDYAAFVAVPPQPSLIVAKPAPVIDTAISGGVAIRRRRCEQRKSGAPHGRSAPAFMSDPMSGRVLTYSSASITASTNCDYLRLPLNYPLNVNDRATSLSSPFKIKKVKVHQLHLPGTLRKADSAAGRPQLHVQAPSNAAAIPAHPPRALPSLPSLRHAGTQSPAPQLAHQWWPQQWL